MEFTSGDALIVFAHGSRVPEANEGVARVAAAAAARLGVTLWREAFLELAEPSLAQAVLALKKQGARKIVVAPYFLMMGIHLQRDLPRLIEEVKQQIPGVELISAPPLDGHPALVEILADRARSAVSA